MSSLTFGNCQHNTLILKVFGQWIPDSRASNRKHLTAMCAEPVAWYRELMTAGQMQTLAEKWRHKLVNRSFAVSIRCQGAWLCWRRYISTLSLYLTHSGISSHDGIFRGCSVHCLCQVNGVNGGDTIFVLWESLCVSLCLCAATGQSDQLKRLKLWISNLTCMFPRTIQTWLLKNSSKMGHGQGHVTP